MIDWWLLFASNILVVTMAFHTYLAFICESAKVEKHCLYVKRSFWIPRLNILKKENDNVLLSENSLQRQANRNENIGVDKETTSLNGKEVQSMVTNQMSVAMWRAQKFNDFAKVIYLAIVVTFNIAFWTIVITEYSRPASYYLLDNSNKTEV